MPKAAGALWIIIAIKTIRLRPELGRVEEAPRAIPSAAEWMTSPTVVAGGLLWSERSR